MNPVEQYIQHETRRQFFGKSAMGLGVAALGSLMPSFLDKHAYGLGMKKAQQNLGKKLGQIGGPHHKPTAKRVIYLFMSGAPCQQDMFDYKPKMNDYFDKDLPESIRQGQRLTTMTSGQKRFPIAPSKYKFGQYGQAGAHVSELLPYHTKMVDDLAFVKSTYTEAINHDPAITYIQTGRQIPGWPSLGSWLSYGLGSENENLPAFMVMNATWTGRQDAQALYNRLWGSGTLPSKYSGVMLRRSGDPVLYLSNPKGVDTATRRKMLDRLQRFNQRNFETVGDPETEARIAQYEMAFRMQASVPELTDLSNEPKHILEMYGPDVNKPGTFAASCLLARRMAERDVRCIQIFHRGWDQHFNVAGHLPKQCKDIDQPAWALITDLKQRGLLDDTLVVWGGEFGRTVYCQGKLTRENYGRDHHPRCFTMWMAGGGVKGGVVHGETDDFSYNVVKDPVHIRDINATILHTLGLNHQKLSVQHQGLDVKLTGVEEAHPINNILL